MLTLIASIIETIIVWILMIPFLPFIALFVAIWLGTLICLVSAFIGVKIGLRERKLRGK